MRATASGSCSWATSSAPSRTRRIGLSSSAETRKRQQDGREQGGQHDAAVDQRAAASVVGGGGQLLVDAGQQVVDQGVVLPCTPRFRRGRCPWCGSCATARRWRCAASAIAGSESPSALARRSMATPSAPSSAKRSSEPVPPVRSVATSACCMASENRPPRVWARSSRRGSGSSCSLTIVVISWVTPDWSCRSWATQVPRLRVPVLPRAWPGSGRERRRPGSADRGEVGRVPGLRQLVGCGLQVRDGGVQLGVARTVGSCAATMARSAAIR